MGFFELFAAGLAAFYGLIPSYGLAIVLLTIAVRLLLLPLSIKQTRSMREMQRIQPEVKKLQAKHKGDRQKLNEEMMKLYKEHGVNPFGGCLPLLMQFPVFIALYRVIGSPLAYLGYKDADGNAGPPFDWVPDAAARTIDAVRDSALSDGLLEIPLQLNRFLGMFRLDCKPSQVVAGRASDTIAEACGNGIVSFIPYVLLILAMGYTTWYQQKQMQGRQTTTSDAQAQQMQMMGKIMPLMLMFFSYQFPAGLTLYWLTSNLWTIGQQRLMFQIAGDDPAKEGNGAATKVAGAAGGGGKGKPAPGKPAKKATSKPTSPEAPGDGNPKSGKQASQSTGRKKKKR